jgi:hypothetical protein
VSIRGKKIFCCMDTAKTAQIPGQTDFPGVTGEFISALFVFFAVDGKQI